MTDLRLALLSSCTIDYLRQPLTLALRSHSIDPVFWTGGFGQYRQEVLDSTSGLYAHNPSLIVLYLDGADLFQELLEQACTTSSKAGIEVARDRAAELAAICEVLAERLPRTTILVNTVAVDPMNAFVGLEYNSEYGIQEAVATYNAALAGLAKRLRTVRIVDVAALTAVVGFETWYDARMWYLTRSRWSRAALRALADRYSAAISSSVGAIRKCIVVDLDNTLWGGVVGEDGLEGLLLGEDGVARSYVEFQLELLNLYRKGIILAICSKNNPEDALQVIRQHPAMRLREEHFAAVRINWEDKATNLRSLAEELNIGLDSFVFLDDSAVERSLVKQTLPEVVVPDLPADPSGYKSMLLRVSTQYFYKAGITAEDRRKGEAYRAQAERRKLESSATSLEQFYATLGMHAKIGRADSFTIPRIAQLTQKTNQFNLTTRRYSEAEVASMSQNPDCSIWWLELCDKFGPSGVVGVLILRRSQGNSWAIDTFLLSCRVMGRTAESAFLAVVAKELEATELIGEYRPTSKNAVVKDLYPRLGFQPLREDSGATLWQLASADRILAVPAWFEIEFVATGLVSTAR
jgi:FkbH-like protein